MRELGREYQGVQFPDGRYFGSLMVYHHLHCLVTYAPDTCWDVRDLIVEVYCRNTSTMPSTLNTILMHALKPVTKMISKSTQVMRSRPNRWQSNHTDSDFAVEHCLGALKAYVMCKADVTIETMLWSPKHSLPLHNVTSTHQCVKWDSILDYAKANNEDVFADGMLVHPSYGTCAKNCW